MTLFSRLYALWQRAVADMGKAPPYPLAVDEWETMQCHAAAQVISLQLQQELSLQQHGKHLVVLAE